MTPSYTTILETYVANFLAWKQEPGCPGWLREADEAEMRRRAADTLHYVATHGRQDPYWGGNPILQKTGRSLGLKTGKAFRVHVKNLPEFVAIAASEATVKTQPR